MLCMHDRLHSVYVYTLCASRIQAVQDTQDITSLCSFSQYSWLCLASSSSLAQ